MKLTYCSAILGLILALSHVSVGAPKPPASSGLQAGFYIGRCPNSPDIQAFIEAEVAIFFVNNPTIIAKLLRLTFHDCFVTGCDASILINGTSNEITAGANIDIGGIDFIDTLKRNVEAKCPGIVSCADIIAIATRVALNLGSGGAINYIVQTGRRDGTISNAQDVNLPHPSMSVSVTFDKFFGPKGFTLEEMVLLTACHTVGVTQCQFFRNRLYPGNPEFDPNMDEALRQRLILVCPPIEAPSNMVLLDQGEMLANQNKVDISYLNEIANRRGILGIDQALTRDSRTNTSVNNFINDPASFNTKLGEAIRKLQAVGVLTGTKGNIRKVCSKFNT